MYDIYTGGLWWISAIVTVFVIVGFILWIVTHFVHDGDSEYDKKERANAAHWFLMSLLTIPAMLVWPLAIPAGLLYGVYRLVPAVRRDLNGE